MPNPFETLPDPKKEATAIRRIGEITVQLLDRRYAKPKDILREIGKRNKRLRVQIHCVSIGRDSTLLKKLAAQSGGMYMRG